MFRTYKSIMKLSLAVLFITIPLATTSTSWASSHREAPTITYDASANISDVYSFKSDERQGVIQKLEPAMKISDVNGDEIPDIVITNPDKFSVFIGNGDGTFAEQIDTPITVNGESRANF